MQITWSKTIKEPIFIGYRNRTANTADATVRPPRVPPTARLHSHAASEARAGMARLPGGGHCACHPRARCAPAPGSAAVAHHLLAR